MDFSLPTSDSWESTPAQDIFIRNYFKKRKYDESAVTKKSNRKTDKISNNTPYHINKFSSATKVSKCDKNTTKMYDQKEIYNIVEPVLKKKRKRKKKRKLSDMSLLGDTNATEDSVDDSFKTQDCQKLGKSILQKDKVFEEPAVGLNKFKKKIHAPLLVNKFSTMVKKESNEGIVNKDNESVNMSQTNNSTELNLHRMRKKEREETVFIETSSNKNTNENVVNQFCKLQNSKRLNEPASEKNNSLAETKYLRKTENFPAQDVENDGNHIIKLDKSFAQQIASQSNVKQKKIKSNMAKNEYNHQTDDKVHDNDMEGTNHTQRNNISPSNKFKKAIPFRNKAQEKLRAAKFRYLNEKLYTETGKEAFEYFQANIDEYEDYHVGYSSQVTKWPINPVDVIIKDLQIVHKSSVIVDLGCGDAKIAQTYPDRSVFSFDLVALNKHVTACDMSQLPVPKESVDIAVFCLSLMGLNLKDYLYESYRILKLGGVLKIAEVESRIENLGDFITNLQSFGFSLEKQNVEHKMFVFLDFKKVKKKLKKAATPNVTLKPCLYKKR